MSQTEQAARELKYAARCIIMRQHYVVWAPWAVVVVLCFSAGWQINTWRKLSATQAVLIGHVQDELDRDSMRIIASNDGVILSWGNKLESLLGYTADEVVGKSLTVLVPGECIDDHTNGYEHMMENGSHKPKTMCQNAVRKDGRHVPISISAEVMETIDGVHVVVADLSPRGT